MKPKLKKLSNGLSVVLVNGDSERTATVLVLVTTGSKYETHKERGIAHFLEHLCFKGTTKRPNTMIISSELDGLGAEYNAFTGHEFTGYYAKVAATHIEKAVDIIGDIYVNSLISAEDVEKEKGVIADEINMYEDVPMRKIGDIFMKTLYGDQPAGLSIAGEKEDIAKYTRRDVLNFRKKHYVPSATTVVVSGKFDETEVMKQIKSIFGKIEDSKKIGKKKVNDKQESPAITVFKKESDQTHIIIGVRTFPLMHDSYYALSVLSAVLGGGMSSRLFHKVRVELGLGYYVRAANDAFTDHGVLAASVGVDNMKAPEVVPAIIGEFNRMKDELVDEEELNKTKEMIAGRLYLGLESTDELAEFYGFQYVLRNEFIKPEEIIKKIKQVTAKDIQDLAKKIFIDKHLNMAVIGPWKDDKNFKKSLKF
jgi:predicted Zn-dependent peptidase